MTIFDLNILVTFSKYYEKGLHFSLYYFYKLSIQGGLGTFRSELGKGRIAGNGLLMNWGIRLQPAPNFAFELSLLTGKMEPGNVDAYLSESTEYNFTLGVAYTF